MLSGSPCFVVLLLSAGGLLSGAFAQQNASATASAAKQSSIRCTVRQSAITEAEKAFARDHYAEAVVLFRAQMKDGSPDPDRAHDGLIRSLIRTGKLSEAEADATAWNKAEPKNSWSAVALGQALWRRGKVVEALSTIQMAAALDQCNPQARVEFARILAMSGMKASAKRNIDIAHTLDPNDPTITDAWVGFQPRAIQLNNLTAYLKQRDDFSDVERKYFEHERQRLSEPPVSRCQLASSIGSTSIPFRGIQDGPASPVYWGLDVAFNGKTRRLEIDTGAHGLLLTRSAASALHLVPDTRLTTGGIGDEGDVDSFIANVENIRIGTLEFHNCDVRELGKNVKTMQAKDGLIGGDVFASFLLTLDFPGRLLKLDPLPAVAGASKGSDAPTLDTGVAADDEAPKDRTIDASMKNWTKVFRSGHDLILPVQLNDGPMRLFIVDTGSSLNLISHQTAREVAKVSNGSEIQLYGISGEVKKLYTTGPLTLAFAGLKQPASGMTAMDTSRSGEETGVEIAGFLGAPTLHQLTVQIDYRDDLMNFSYDPKRIQHCMGSAGMQMADCY